MYIWESLTRFHYKMNILNLKTYNLQYIDDIVPVY